MGGKISNKNGATIDLDFNISSGSVEAKLKDIVNSLDIIQQSSQLDLKFKNIKGVSTFIQNLAKLDEKLDDIKTSANVAGDELSKSMSKSASKVVEDITSMSAKSADLTRELKSLSEMKDLSTAQDKVKKIAKSINASLSFVDPGNLIDVDELLNVKDSQKQLDILAEGLKNFTTGWTSLGQSGIRATNELKHGLAGSSGEADNLQKKLTSIKSLLDEINGNSFKTRINRIKSDKLDSAKPTRNQEPANLISNAFSDYTDAVGVLKNDSATIEEKTKAYIQLTNAVHDLGWAIEELPDDVDSVLGKKGAIQIEEMLDNYRDNYLKLIDSIKKDLQQEINVVMGVEPDVDPNVDGKVKKAVEGSMPEQIEVDTGVKIDVTATIKQLDELLIKFRELKDNKDKTGVAETANEIAKLTLSLQDCGVEFDAIKNQLSANNKRTFSSNAIKDAINQTNELRSHVPEVSAEFDKLNRLLGENFVGKEKFTDIFDAVKKGTMHAEDAYKTIKAAQEEIVKGDAASDVEKLTSALKKTFNTDEIKSGWKTTIAEVESGKVKWIDALTEITKAELDFNNIQNKAIKKDSKKYQNQAEKAQKEAAEANERARKAEEKAEELQKELNKQKQAPSHTPAVPTPQKIKQQIRDSYSGILYHGSKSPMTNETYDPSKNKLSNRNLGVGLYFTPDLELASKYGKNILQQNINLDKIFVLTKDFITDVDALYKAMGKVKPENSDWETIKKDLHGAMMVAENAKAFTKNMQEMGYQGVYSKGYGFADPEVEQLAIYDEKYHKNLTTIPYKDIKKQAEGAAQALEQIEQQEKDIAKAAKEREEIQRKANEVPKPSGTGIGTGTGTGTGGTTSPSGAATTPSIKAEIEDLERLEVKVKEVENTIRTTKTQAFKDEQTVVAGAVNAEIEDLSRIESKVNQVTDAVVEKTSAFTNEQATVNESVDKEIEDLSRLENKINDVTTSVNNKTTSFKEEEKTIDTNTNNNQDIIAEDKHNEKLQERAKIYERLKKHIAETIALQKTIDSGNMRIIPEYRENGNLSSGFGYGIGKGWTTDNHVTKKLIKDKIQTIDFYSKDNESGKNDKRINNHKDELAAYVATYKDLDKAKEIFGKKEIALWNEILERIELAQKAKDAYKKAGWEHQFMHDDAKSLGDSDTKYTYGDRDKLASFIQNGDADGALQFLTEKFKIEIEPEIKSGAVADEIQNNIGHKPVDVKVDPIADDDTVKNKEQPAEVASDSKLSSTLETLNGTLSKLIGSNDSSSQNTDPNKGISGIADNVANIYSILSNPEKQNEQDKKQGTSDEDTKLSATLNALNDNIARMVGSNDPASQNTDPNKGLSGIADNVANIYGILNGRKDNDDNLATSIKSAVDSLNDASKHIADDAKLRKESNTKYQAASDRISTDAGRKDVLDRIMGQYSNDYFIPDQASTNYTSHTGGIVKVETVLQGLDNKFYDFAATIDSQGVVAVKKMEENGSKSIAVQNQIAEQERKLAQAREAAAKKIKQETAGEYLERKKQEALAKERTISYDIVKPQVDSTIKAYDAFSAQNVANIPANLKNDYNAFLQIIKELKTENRNLSEDEVTAVESFCSGIQKEINNIKEKNAALEAQNTLIKQYESEYDKIYNKIISNDKHDGKTGLDIAKEFYLSRNPNMSDKQLDNISKSMIERSLRNVFNHDPSQGRSLSIKGSKNDWNVLDPDFYLKEYQAYDEILQLIGYHLGEIKPLMIDEKTQWGFTADAIANSDHVILNLEEARNILLSLSETQSVDSNLFGLEDTEKAKKLLDSIKLELNTLQQQDEHGIKLLSVEELESSKQRLKEYTSELQNMIKTANANSTKGSFTKRYDDQLRKSANALNKFKEDTQNINLSADVQNTVDKYEAAIQKLKDMRTAFENTSKGQLTVDQKNQWDEAVNEAKEYQKELEKILKIHNKIASDGQIDLNEIDPNINTNNATQMYDAMKKYLEIVYGSGAVIKGVGKDHKSLNATFTDAEGRINEVTIAYNKLNNTLSHHAAPVGQVESAWTRLTTSIGNKVREMAAYFATFGSVYEVINIVRQGITYVREIDSALTELKKVTDETDEAYAQFLQNMSKTAGVVGSTVKDLTTMAAEWARLGYSMQEASKLAESTAILLNVSEFSDATEASEALISTMQAFQYTADESVHVVDILNEVGNNYAVSSDGIATALQDSASALMEGGNNLEQAVALVAAANKVVQDPNSVGSALRTISLRLRGTSVKVLEELGEETDNVVESTSKLQSKIKALSGVDILTESGDYKDTYTILAEIGEVWEDMSDIDQAALLELMAGKNRANTLSAILSNMKDLKGAYQDAMAAEGSALKENEAYLDSIQGRIDLFTNSLQTMWMNAISSDAIKSFVDAGTTIIKIIDKIGAEWIGLGAIISLIAMKIADKNIFDLLGGGFKYLKNIISGTKFFETLSLNFLEIAHSAMDSGKSITGLSGAFTKASAGVSAFAQTLGLSTGGLFAIVAAIGAVIAITAKYHKTNEELIEDAEKLTSAYKETSDSIKENISTIQSVQDEFNKLSKGVDDSGNNISLAADDYQRYQEILETILGITPSLIEGYDAEGKAIANKNGLIEDSIKLLQEQQRIEAQKLVSDENLETIGKGIDAEKETYENENPLPYGDTKYEFMKVFKEAASAYAAITGNYEGMIYDALNPDNLDLDDFWTEGYWSKYGDSSENFAQDYYEQIVEDLRSEESVLSDYFTQEQVQNMLYYADQYQKNVNVYNKDIDAYNKKFNDALQTVPLAETSYYTLSDEMKGYLTQYINGLEVTSDTLLEKKQEIIDFTNFLSNNTNAQDILSLGSKLKLGLDKDSKSLSYTDYLNEVKNLINDIKNSDFSDSEQNLLLEALGLNQDSKEFDNEIKETVTNVKNKLSDEFDHMVDNMSITDIKLAYEITADPNSLTFEELREKIDELKGQRGIDVTTFKTYSEIAEGVSKYNEILLQTSEIISDNIEVTQEYKDSLVALGINEDKLNECFYENNPLVVKNSSLLNKLVAQYKKAQKATIQVAKSQAQLQYKDLVRQIRNSIIYLGAEAQANGFVTQATFDNIDAMQEQLATLKQTIQQYALLEISMSDAANAFDEYEKAKERDAQLTYDDSMLEMLKTIDEGLLKNETGTEAFEYAVKAIVPEQFWKDIDDVDEKIRSIHDYIDGDNVFSRFFYVDEESGDLDITTDNVREFVDLCIDSGLFDGSSKDFALSNSVQGVKDFADALGVTEPVILAMLSALEDVDAKWGNILTDVTTTPLDRAINDSADEVYNVTQDIEDFWKAAEASGQFDDSEYQKLLNSLEEANKKLKESEQAAQENARQYNILQSAISSFAGNLKLTEQDAQGLVNSLKQISGLENIGEIIIEDGQLKLTDSQIDLILQKLGLLEEPSVMQIQLRYDDIISQINELNKYIEGEINDPNDSEILKSINITNIEEAKAKLNELTPEKENIELTYNITETSSAEQKSVLESYQELAKNGMEFTVTANVTDAEKKLTETEAKKVNDKSFKITADGSTAEQVIKSIADNLAALKDKNVTISVTEKRGIIETITSIFSGGNKSEDGASGALGNAFASGNIGLKQSEHNTVVGELGREMIVDPYKGVYYTVGDNGTEMVNLPKGAIIYNHKQTEELLKKGHTSRGNYTGGLSFANGNAHEYGIPSYHPNLEDPTSLKNYTNANKDWMNATSTLLDSADALDDASNSIDDAADEFKETINWIEVLFTRIDNILAEHEAYFANIVDSTGGIAAKESVYNTMYGQMYSKASYSLEAAQYYQNLADTILAGMDAVIAEKVRTGTILIEEITDEALKENIDKALEYLDQKSQYEQQYYQTITEIADKAKEHLDEVAQAYENEIGLTEHLNDMLEAHNDLLETREGFAAEAYYKAQISANKTMLSQYKAERKALQAVLDEEVRLGHVKIGDSQWFEMQQAIYDVDDAIIDMEASIEDLQNSINDLHWDRFDELINRFGYIEEEISNVIQLLSHDPDGLITEELRDLTSDNWANDSGLATIGLYAQEMERAQYVANEYAQAIKDLKRDYAAGKYNETEYLNKLNELTSSQMENIEKYYDAKDAIIELNETRVDAIRDGIEREIDAYDELIQKKKELLDKEQD